MTTDYATIYDHVVSTNAAYTAAEHSPGYQLVLENLTRLKGVKGPALDIGCGAGFALQKLMQPPLNLDAFGIDISPAAIELASRRVDPERVQVASSTQLPFDDNRFDLITCFDVFEHLDEVDLPQMINEIRRVTRPGGLMMLSAALRAASATDQFGDNVHRTVKPVQWWIDLIDPDEAQWIKEPAQAIFWINK